MPEQQASNWAADQRSANSRLDAVVCGIQRRLSIIQERCEATEAMCKETFARLEDRFTTAKADTASEHAAMKVKIEEHSNMKVKIEEHSNRIDMMLSTQSHCYGDVWNKLEDLAVQMSNLIVIFKQKPPQHLALDCCNSLDSVLSPGQTGDWSTGSPPPVSVVAVPTPAPARDVCAAATTSKTGMLVQGPVDTRPQVMFTCQLPGTGDSSNAQNLAEEPKCQSEAVDGAWNDCESWYLQPDLTTAETTPSAGRSSDSAGRSSEVISSTVSYHIAGPQE